MAILGSLDFFWDFLKARFFKVAFNFDLIWYQKMASLNLRPD